MKARQTADTISGIRDDHVERYRFAATEARDRGLRTVVDAGCGVGYGAYLMVTEGGLDHVIAFDQDQGAIDHARSKFASRRVDYVQWSMKDAAARATGAWEWEVDLVIAFEIIEHTPDASAFLRAAAGRARVLIGSVPNERVVPFSGAGTVNTGHYRHYTPSEIEDELMACGWYLVGLGCQKEKRGPEARVRFDRTDGRTLVFVAKSSP